MITLTKQDIDNIVVKARDYLESHASTDWVDWDEDGVVNKLTDDYGLLKIAIMDQFLWADEGNNIINIGGSAYVWPFTADNYAESLIKHINDNHGTDEYAPCPWYFEEYVGNYVKVAA